MWKMFSSKQKNDTSCLVPRKACSRGELRNLANQAMNTDGEFVRKEVFYEYAKRIDQRCEVHGDKIDEIVKATESNRKTQFTSLVFIIVTLVSILTAIAVKIF